MSVLNRVLCLAARRTFSTTSRLASDLVKKENENYLPDPLEHACGLEKKQLIAHLEGNDDPFDLTVSKRGPGTKDQPNIVFSSCHERLIGCICEEESISVSWMWLQKDEPKRCGCGHWFKLQYKEPMTI